MYGCPKRGIGQDRLMLIEMVKGSKMSVSAKTSADTVGIVLKWGTRSGVAEVMLDNSDISEMHHEWWIDRWASRHGKKKEVHGKDCWKVHTIASNVDEIQGMEIEGRRRRWWLKYEHKLWQRWGIFFHAIVSGNYVSRLKKS